VQRLGLLGCGNIGSIIARHGSRSSGIAVYVRHPERRQQIAACLNAVACDTFDDFLATDFAIPVEAASVQAQILIPMATSLAFGLTSAKLITIFLVPLICYVSDDFNALGQVETR